VDDVGFVEAVIDDVSEEHDVDERRIFAFGHSNGGMMSYRPARELADRVAAVAVVSGTLALETCVPEEPTSVLHVHGTVDGTIPIDPSPGKDARLRVDLGSPVEGFERRARGRRRPPLASRSAETVTPRHVVGRR